MLGAILAQSAGTGAAKQVLYALTLSPAKIASGGHEATPLLTPGSGEIAGWRGCRFVREAGLAPLLQ